MTTSKSQAKEKIRRTKKSKNSIPELRALWQKEKDFYRKVELGTGVHSFVKKVFESEEIFNLKEGRLSTNLNQRRNEFIHEKKAKEKRKADFVIFINSEIVIPVEAECYGDIEAGESQLFNYQKDFDKQYGILTDGYTWRFYNNNIFRSFTLEDIFDDVSLFLEFWREYIKPEFYYLSFFEPTGQLTLLEKTKLHVEENRQLFFEDITRLIKSFKNKLKVEGYFRGLDKREKEKRAIEITYAYIIQFILYKTLVDNDFGKFGKEYKEIVEAIYNCLKTRQYGKILGIIDGISNEISKNIYHPFKKEQEFITDTILAIIRKPKNELREVSPWLDIFVFIKKYNFANIQNEIFGYIYENYLKELYQDEQKGQYFTDPAVVNFMLGQIGFTPERLRKRYAYDKDSISLIDPACGSGTFLYSAVDGVMKTFGNHSEEKSKKVEEIVNNNIFGLDIAEFPLYLAEMNILMRMLPMIIAEKYNNPVDKKIKVFLTKDSVTEFMDTALRNTMHDIDVKGGQLSWDFKELDLGYKSYVREENDLEEMKKSLEKQPKIPRRRFDYVVGNPPYVGYNECCKQKLLITQLIKNSNAQMSNIYGVNLNTVPGRIKAYAPKPNLYSFFIALGLALLKDDGKLCYIVPQTLLTATDLDVVRYHLAKFTTIEKIITFGGKMFIGRGLKQDKPVPTSSLIFVVSREIPSKLHKIEIINSAEDKENIEEIINNLSRGKKIHKKWVLQAELLRRVGNWNFITFDKQTEDFIKEYKERTESVDVYRLPELARLRNLDVFYFDKGLVFPKNKIVAKEKIEKISNYFYLTKANKNKYRLTTIDYVVPFSAVRFPKGSQGIKVFKKKYKIIWRYMNYDKFYFTDEKIITNFNWIVISSDDRQEMVYLLALLNSKLNNFFFQSLLKLKGEKDILLGIKAVKSYFRVPKITEDNQHVKNEIIKHTEKILVLEEKMLSDFVDFSKVMIQKFDRIAIEGNDLVLKKNNEQIKLAIKSNRNLVRDVIKKKYGEDKLNLESQKINLSELKSSAVIDFDKQRGIKNDIDNLVFALYFNIDIPKNKLNKPEAIKKLCQKNKFYKGLNEK